MSDYDPARQTAKWHGQMEHLLAEARDLWDAGKPRKPFFSRAFPEVDSRQDEMATAAAKRILGYEGKVVWGHFARAFIPAYIAGTQTHYGSVVYSTDATPRDSIFDLAAKVNQLRDGKSEIPKGTEQLARAINDDRSQFTRLTLPPALGVTGNCFLANLCIHRSRLPLGYIHDRLVPLLIAPEKTEWCSILPLRFWPDTLQAHWTSGPPAGDQARYRAMCAAYNTQP
jgi:hypothetical protein